MIDLDMPDAEYRATRALSYSGAKDLMRSPALFRYRLDHPRPDSTDFDLGHAAHTKLLAAGADVVVVEVDDEPVDNFNRKDAREARDRIRAAGHTPVTWRQYEDVMGMVDAVRAHPLAGKLLEPGRGHGEVSVFWDDPETGTAQRARLDWLIIEDDDGRPRIVDVKTTTDVRRAALSRTINEHHYNWQQPQYLDGLAAHGVDDAAFTYVFVEKSPPHLVRVVELDADAVAAGRRFIQAARRLYAACLDDGDWPAYPPQVELIGLPRFAPTDPGDVIL